MIFFSGTALILDTCEDENVLHIYEWRGVRPFWVSLSRRNNIRVSRFCNTYCCYYSHVSCYMPPLLYIFYIHSNVQLYLTDSNLLYFGFSVGRYLGSTYEHDTISIFTEFIPGGSLLTIIDRFGPLEIPVTARYTRQLLSAVAYMHANNVVHRYNFKLTILLCMYIPS